MGLFSLGGIGSFITDAVSSAFNAHLGRQNARNNAALSRGNWAYMQSNAHQLEVQDLKNAGLNPILSATNSQIAGMGSVSGQNGSSDGLGSSILAAASAKELKRMDLENELLKTKVDAAKNGITVKDDGSIERRAADERFGAGTENIKADTALKNSSKSLQDAQSRFVDIQGKELVRLNDAQIASIFNHMNNESALTSAQISEIESKKRVNDAQIDALEAQAKQAIENSNLAYWQKLDIITDINSASRKLRNLTDEQRYQYLSGSLGNVQNQTGFGLTLMNPFSNFGMRAGSGYVGSRKK